MKIGILGFGTVASASVNALVSHQDLIRLKLGTPLLITKIATRTVARVGQSA